MNVAITKNTEQEFGSAQAKSLEFNDRLICINTILETAFGTPDLGNKVDPLDELLFLILAQRTRINLARQIFEEVKKEFNPWAKVLVDSNQTKLKTILAKGGRGNLRYKAIREIVTNVNKIFGEVTLDPIRSYSQDDAERFLLSLPWVGKKTAYCILLYSLGYGVFPVDSNILRVFARTNLFQHFGLPLNLRNHKEAQEKIAPLIPKKIAYPLHVNMVMHGREICISRKPKCGICPIRVFCDFYRKSKYENALNFKLSMVDLFSGAGGISYGFAKAGIRPLLAIDNCEHACNSYSLNIPWIEDSKIINRDIPQIKDEELFSLIGKNKVDILVAGVPCKGFSRVGLKSKPELKKKKPPESAKINQLFLEVIRWARLIRPSIVLLENVPDMKSTQVFYENSLSEVRGILESSFFDLGYSTRLVHLNSAKFGVPETRKRMFFVAAKPGINLEKLEEKIETCWKEINNSNQNNAKLQEALEGIAPLPPGGGKDFLHPQDYPSVSKLKEVYQKFTFDSPYVMFNHVARKHNEDDMRIISAIQPSETYKKLLIRMPEVVKNRKMKVYSTETFHDKFYRLDLKKPGRTIVSHLAKDGNSFIHPVENRSITVREAARIQSFPDSFYFTGSRTAQYIQVGNAVPPLLAYVLGLFLKKLVEEGKMNDH